MTTKKILITGNSSYIGNSFAEYIQMRQDASLYEIDKISLRDDLWRDCSWERYDVVLHVAGIAHVDVRKASEETKQKYYAVNRDLTVEAAEKAKREGIKQFIFLSSMIVYGSCGKVDRNTVPAPANFYGDSKWQAEQLLMKKDANNFKVVIVRPPFVYGKGSKGNYPLLVKLSRITPVFPKYSNKKSMIYIENLCEFIRLLILKEESGVYHPQNKELVSTAHLVATISKAINHKIWFTPFFNIFIKISKKRDGIMKKVFGDFFYIPEMSVYEGIDYQIYGLEESIKKTEENK